MIITMPVPPSVNAMYRNVRGVGRVKTSAYRVWLLKAPASFVKNGRPVKPISGPVSVCIVAPHNGRRDLDNHVKPVLDLLSKGPNKLIDSDRCATVRVIHMSWAEKGSILSNRGLLKVEVVAI